jgi:hypothetical protein
MGLGDGGVSASDVGAAPLGAGLIFLSVNFPVASFQHDRSARIPPTFLMHAPVKANPSPHGFYFADRQYNAGLRAGRPLKVCHAWQS